MTDIPSTSRIGYALGATEGRTFQAINPAEGIPFGPVFHSASREDVARAAVLAQEAFRVYGPLPGSQRAAFLVKIAEQIEAALPVLLETTPLETGLPAGRIQMETGRTCGQLRLFATVAANGDWIGARIDPGNPSREPLPKPDLRSMLIPIGPVAVFGASNFPLAFSVAGGDTASALAAGCPVVVKAHPAHPATSAIIGEAILNAARETGMPEGVFSLLFDVGHEVGAELVKQPQIKAVGFTGSRTGGRAIMDLAANRKEPIPVFAEMSSINPLVILPEALAEKGAAIAEGLAGSITLGVGQFCTCPGLLLVPTGPAGDALVADLAHRLKSHPPGVMLTPGIAENYTQKLAAVATIPGIDLSGQGEAPEENRSAAALLTTTSAVFKAHPEAQDEIFGPCALVVRYVDTADLLQTLEVLEGQLTASIHATPSELENAPELIHLLAQKAGRLVFNGFPTGVEVCHAMVHGGPYPATSDGRSTSVGTSAILRFGRLISYQNFPDACLPEPLKADNPGQLTRIVNGTTQVSAQA